MLALERHVGRIVELTALLACVCVALLLGHAHTQLQKKNILTNPGKRGTFGYTGTLIGGSIPAMPAEFESERREARSDQAKHRAVMGEKKAFKSTATGVDFFDAHEHVAARKVLGWDDTCIVKPPGALELMNPKERAVAKASTFKPWKPNNPIKDGEQGCVLRSLYLSISLSICLS